jgi:hypothetical protein
VVEVDMEEVTTGKSMRVSIENADLTSAGPIPIEHSIP